MNWITDKDFLNLKPIDVFHKQYAVTKPLLHREDLKNRHMLIRKKFIFEDTTAIKMQISADDYYKLYINGKFVGQGPAPAYHIHYNWNEYDISSLLKQGDNIIAVHVYYQGLINRVWNSGDYRMGMGARVISNGELLFETDATWKYIIAQEFIGKETIGYDTQFKEDIDNRKKICGWKDIDFKDDEWIFAEVNTNTDYIFNPEPVPSLEVYNIKPSLTYEIEKGNYIIDFGQEITGRLIISANGTCGDNVLLRFGEELENKNVKYKMRCNCDYGDKWILSGGDNQLEQYDYKAFRYVQIISENAVIDISSAAAEVRHYRFNDSVFSISSSNVLLDKIIKICKNSVKYGTQEGFLDCPSREKGQYLGDATITAQSHAYLTGDYTMYKKCLNDFALSSRICPGLTATAPGSWMQEIADFSLQWPFQLLKYYNLSGDIEFLKKMLPTAQGLINYFKRYTRQDDLINDFTDKPILVDWPSNMRDDYDFKLMPERQNGCCAVLNAFYIGAVETVSNIKKILGLAYDNDEFKNLKNAFIKTFFNNEKKLFTDAEGSSHSSLHANALALFFKLAPDTNKIIDFIRKKRLSCGVYTAYFVLKALAEAGEHEFVFELLTSQDEHSWGNMINEGATTCFEAWGKEQKWNTSLCHPWASSPIIILIEDIAGVKISEPGWKKVEFKPNYPTTLDFLKITIPTLKGTINIDWKR